MMVRSFFFPSKAHVKTSSLWVQFNIERWFLGRGLEEHAHSSRQNLELLHNLKRRSYKQRTLLAHDHDLSSVYRQNQSPPYSAALTNYVPVLNRGIHDNMLRSWEGERTSRSMCSHSYILSESECAGDLPAEAQSDLVPHNRNPSGPVWATLQTDSSYTAEVNKIVDILKQRNWPEDLLHMRINLSGRVVAEVLRRQPHSQQAFSFFVWAGQQQDFEHTPHTYKVMLQKLIKSRSFAGVNLSIFEELVATMVQKGWIVHVTAWTYLLNELCRVGRVDSAVEQLNDMVNHGSPPNVVTYSCVISTLIKLGRVEDSLKLFNHMKQTGCIPNVVTYSGLIYGLLKDQQLEKACLLFAEMKENGCKPNMVTYSCLIDALVKSNKYQDVCKILEEIREEGFAPTVFIYGIVVNYFVKIDKKDEAWMLFSDLKLNHCKPNLYIFTPLMYSLLKAGNWEQADRLLTEMRSSGCAPDVIVYSALIAGLSKAGKWDEGGKLLAEMEANDLIPTGAIYTVLMRSLIKAGQLEEAYRLADKMILKGYSPRNYTVCSVSKALGT